MQIKKSHHNWTRHFWSRLKSKNIFLVTIPITEPQKYWRLFCISFPCICNNQHVLRIIDINSPITVETGMQYLFLLYNYGSNSSLFDSVKNGLMHPCIEPYNKLFTYLTNRGFKPCLNIRDNESSSIIKSFILKW